MVLFSSFIIVWSLLHPEKIPQENIDMRFRDRFKAIKELGPVVTLMLFIFTALFAGWITATETAAWGVLGAILVAVYSGTFNWTAFRDSVRAAVRTSCMIIILVAAAGLMSSFMAVAGIPKAVATSVGAMHLGPLALVAFLVVIYVVLGMFLDGVSMVLLTLPVALPMVTAAGFNPIWFGIFLVIVVEMGAISPPVGFNLFVLQNMTGKNVFTLGWMSLPFFLIMIVLIAAIAVWPQLVMVGPDLWSR